MCSAGLGLKTKLLHWPALELAPPPNCRLFAGCSGRVDARRFTACTHTASLEAVHFDRIDLFE